MHSMRAKPFSLVSLAVVALLWASVVEAQKIVFSTKLGNQDAIISLPISDGNVPNGTGEYVSQLLEALGFRHSFSFSPEGKRELEQALNRFRVSRGYGIFSGVTGGELAMLERLSSTALTPPSQDLKRMIQNSLMLLGYFEGLRDGSWGADSEQALQQFRRDFGLPSTAGVSAEDVYLMFLLNNGRLSQRSLAGAVPAAGPVTAGGGKTSPTRAFAGPDQFPPSGYRGYGVLAFKSIATSFDIDRHRFICQAYASAFLNTSTSKEPTGTQFLTIWPVRRNQNANKLNAISSGPRTMTVDPAKNVECELAISDYDLSAAARAINAARDAGFRDQNRSGPFLLAWSPSATFGASDAFVLSLDLSRVNSFEQAQAMMQDWKSDIEGDFELLASGFSVNKLRTKIRRWADKHGDNFLVVWTRTR